MAAAASGTRPKNTIARSPAEAFTQYLLATHAPRS
jgi:hypothetical protein